MADLQQQLTISCGRRGNLGRFSSDSPPPAAHVSCKPEMVGRRYGHVEIIRPEKRWSQRWNHCYVLTRCMTCGKESWQDLNNLTRGASSGCQSCSQPEPAYPRWLDRRVTAQKQRCTNPADSGYENYGARGVTFDFPSVKDACLWIAANIGIPKNARALDLDRIDNDKGYAPGNLRWCTRRENNGNRRNTRIIEWRAEDWPYSRTTVTRKLAAGLTREQILDEAWNSAERKCRNWKAIKKWFESTTSLTPDPDIALRYRACSSTTAATAGE